MPRLKIKFSDGSGQEISFKGNLISIEVEKEMTPYHEIFETPNKLFTKEQTSITEVIENRIKQAADSFNPDRFPSYGKITSHPNMLGHWKTNEHFHIEIYEFKDNLWIGRCKDCGEGKDKLIYDLNGDPVNYPEFGKLMNRLDVSESFRSL